MAPLVGQEMCVRLFLNRFATLCTDPLFHVRKVCAANFGDFSGVVGSDSTEETLCPVFYALCEDSVWGVRKACADVFMPVSCVCSPQVRKQELSPLFINLLRDQSRWVRMAAFQALGPFISTFADPGITALLHNENGEIVITDTEQLVSRMIKIEEERAAAEEDSLEENSAELIPTSVETDSSHNHQNTLDNDENHKDKDTVNMDTDEDSWEAQLVPGVSELTSPEEMRAEKFLSSSEEYNYSSFLYWRDPVPSLQLTDVDLAMSNIDNDNLDKLPDELLKLELSSAQNETKEETDLATDVLTNKTDDDKTGHCDTKPPAEGSGDSSALELYRHDEPASIISTFEPGWSSTSSPRVRPRTAADLDPPDPSLPTGPPLTQQTIVPQLLVDHYVSMTDPSRAQTVDNDIARHCAFSFPAVALTLGRANWPLLRDTYEVLANDMQWKVRRTLASSIHELGVILGEDLSTAHLVPIFNGFIKDLDEVRIGILKHLADFLNLLSPSGRGEYLPRLEEFLKMDNERNWRFRLELSEQLSSLVPLVSPEDIRYHLAPIALSLVQDRVSCVRQSAVTVISVMLTSLNNSNQPGLARDIMVDLAENLAHSHHWARRQTFAMLCGQLVTKIPYDHFSLDLLPHLLDLTWDVVPNVKLKVAHVFGHILPDEHYDDVSSPNFDLIHQSLTTLAGDKDHDVRQAACLKGRVEACPPPVEPEPDQLQTDLNMSDDQDEIINPTWAQIVETAPNTSREDLETEE